MFEQFLSIWTSRCTGKSPAPARRRLSLETLEDRLTPASLNPVAGDDFGYIFLDKPNPAQASGTTTANKKPIYLSIKGAGLLLNDLDPLGPGVAYQLRARLESPSTTGEVALDPIGNFEIKNLPMDFEGTISFTYRVAGPSGVSEPATVTRVVIRDSQKDHAPVAKDDTVLFGTTAGKAGSLSFDVLSNDMSYLDKPQRTVTSTQPANGRLNSLGAGRFEYTPAPDFNGVDSFTYQHQDGNGASNQARVRVLVVTPALDLTADDLNWDPDRGGLRFRYTIAGRSLAADSSPRVELFWARGPRLEDRIGDPIAIPGFQASGAVGARAVQVPGTSLGNNPPEATYLLLVLDRSGHLAESREDNNLLPLEDVRVEWAPGVHGALSAYSEDVLRDLLRIAGEDRVTLTSLQRTPEEQARAMFDNCLNKGAASQLDLYSTAGDAVVHVYVQMTASMTPAQILQHRASIEAAMLAEVLHQGASKVSHHCADPAELQVVDLAPSSFQPATRQRFLNAAREDVRVKTVLTQDDPAYHLEIPQVGAG